MRARRAGAGLGTPVRLAADRGALARGPARLRRPRLAGGRSGVGTMGMYQAGRLLIKQFVNRNTEYLKRTSSGRDLVFYCGDTPHQWNPELFKRKGFGGSEEAVLYVTREDRK